MNEWKQATRPETLERIETGEFHDRATISTYASGSIQLSCYVIAGNGVVIDSLTYHKSIEAAKEATESIRAKVRALAHELAAFERVP